MELRIQVSQFSVRSRSSCKQSPPPLTSWFEHWKSLAIPSSLPHTLSTALRINWTATSSNRICDGVPCHRKGLSSELPLRDRELLSATCDFSRISLAPPQLEEVSLVPAPGPDKIPESPFPAWRFSFHLTCFINSNSPLFEANCGIKVTLQWVLVIIQSLFHQASKILNLAF